MSTKTVNTRLVAIRFINDVAAAKTSLQSLPTYFPEHTSNQDKRFIQALCFGVLREYIKLNAIIQKYLTGKTKLKVKIVLITGVYQLLFMSQPSYAVINETVKVSRQLKLNWASGLINRLLRLIDQQRHNIDQLVAQLEPFEQLSTPQWLFDAIKLAYPASYLTILNHLNEHPPMFIRLDTNQLDITTYLKQLHQHNINAMPVDDVPGALKLASPVDVSELPGFDQGIVSVQDLSAQRVGHLLPITDEVNLLDACAAPGGKTLHLLQQYPNISVTAVDVEARRLDRVRENLNRCAVADRCEMIQGDVSTIDQWWQGPQMDVILLDAPCSATGVIRRQPDIKLLRDQAQVAHIVELQSQLLYSSWQILKPSGMLLYCTCSILPEENHQQIQAFLHANPDAQLVTVNQLEAFSVGIGYQILPQHGSGDGFYYALLRKEEKD